MLSCVVLCCDVLCCVVLCCVVLCCVVALSCVVLSLSSLYALICHTYKDTCCLHHSPQLFSFFTCLHPQPFSYHMVHMVHKHCQHQQTTRYVYWSGKHYKLRNYCMCTCIYIHLVYCIVPHHCALCYTCMRCLRSSCTDVCISV